MTPERRAKITSVLNNRQPDLAVVLENVEDPHNIFAVTRTCDAVGVQNLYILNSKFSRKEGFGKRSSASAAKWVTVHEFDDTGECMEIIKKKYAKVYATHLSTEASSLYDLNLAESVALVFGNERKGVSEECLAYCDGNFIIPQVGMIRSLNISVACAVSLYEAFRQRQIKGYYHGNCRMPEQEARVLSSSWGLKEE